MALEQNSTYELTIPSDLSQVKNARDFVMAVCHAAGADSASVDRLTLAVHEAVNNAIRHAHSHQVDLPIQIRCYPGPGWIEIQILDEGDPFEMTDLPELDPAELRVGGRGIFLMRRLADEVSCERRGDRGNLIKLVKRWQTSNHLT